MDTRPTGDPDRIADLKRHRDNLESGTATPRLPRAVVAREVRELNREIATLEALYNR